MLPKVVAHDVLALPRVAVASPVDVVRVGQLTLVNAAHPHSLTPTRSTPTRSPPTSSPPLVHAYRQREQAEIAFWSVVWIDEVSVNQAFVK